MNYGQMEGRVLRLLNQYSVAGAPVASSYNNQQDYLNRIPGLVNDAMMEIATSARKIPALLRLCASDAEDLGQTLRFALPQDFYQFKTGDTFQLTEDGRLLHTNRYGLQGKQYLLVPKAELDPGERVEITYYRYPALLPERPAAETELDNTPETHDAAAFYVAAFLVIHDDSFQFASFYNKYEDKLAKMDRGLSVEMAPWEAETDNYGVYEV